MDPSSSSSEPTPLATSTPASAPAHGENTYDPLRSDEAFHPLNNATITVRIIKSFEYRTFRGMVLKGVNLGEVTVGELMERCKRGELFRLLAKGKGKGCVDMVEGKAGV